MSAAKGGRLANIRTLAPPLGPRETRERSAEGGRSREARWRGWRRWARGARALRQRLRRGHRRARGAVTGAPGRVRAGRRAHPAQLRTVHGATSRMADGGRVELLLFPLEGPPNVAIVRIARAAGSRGRSPRGALLVVQGGSRGKEYVGEVLQRDGWAGEPRPVGVHARPRTGEGALFNTVDTAPRHANGVRLVVCGWRWWTAAGRARIRRVTVHECGRRADASCRACRHDTDTDNAKGGCLAGPVRPREHCP